MAKDSWKNIYELDEDGKLIRSQGFSPSLANWIFGKTGRSYTSKSLAEYFSEKYPNLRLTDAEWDAIVDGYYANADKVKGNNWLGTETYYVDLDALDTDLNAYIDALSTAPKRPKYSTYLDDAYAEIDRQNQVEFDALDELLAEQEALYNEDMSNISQGYNDIRTGLLSQQYQQNLQTMDTLQSDMSRARQNALEAGASAGIRIAGNVNALLSAQNKQSATSMDTANQLAQMMISQRNEESAARRNYQSYLQSDAASRSDLRMSRDDRATGLADRNYTSASNEYTADQTDWDNEMRHNPFFGKVPKSKYSSGGTQ